MAWKNGRLRPGLPVLSSYKRNKQSAFDRDRMLLLEEAAEEEEEEVACDDHKH